MNIPTRRKLVHPVYLVLLALTVTLVTTATFAFFLQTPAFAPAPEADNKPVAKEVSRSLLLPGAKTSIPLPIEPSLLVRPTGEWILVNKTNPIALSYIPTDLVVPEVTYRTDKAREEIMVRRAVAAPLKALFDAAEKENLKLLLGSAYRSSKLQETYFNSYARSSGLAEAEKYSAHPGTSEHQLGLAVDISTPDRVCYLETCFETTAAGKWLVKNAHTYGFILRYPKDKSDITGYSYEPWHFRYIGVAPATAIVESGLTYEEAFPYLSGQKQP